jgi:hypothetical protein
MRLLACLLVLPRVGAELVLLDAPPSGFNTFDAYGYAWLNASGVEDLLRTFAQSPLKTQASSHTPSLTHLCVAVHSAVCCTQARDSSLALRSKCSSLSSCTLLRDL